MHVQAQVAFRSKLTADTQHIPDIRTTLVIIMALILSALAYLIIRSSKDQVFCFIHRPDPHLISTIPTPTSFCKVERYWQARPTCCNAFCRLRPASYTTQSIDCLDIACSHSTGCLKRLLWRHTSQNP